jgi:hypothetical protein
VREFSETQKALANRLAELLSGQDVVAIMHYLDVMLGSTVSGKESHSDTYVSNPAGPIRVGIWEQRVRNGQTSFVRTQAGDPWTLWANVGTIPPKSRQKRILFLGESVARGYFYDPHFNPATTLQNILNSAIKSNSVEVIDLARIDLDLDALVQLAESAVALESDAMVIFAGNNWHYKREDGSQDMIEMARILRSDAGWPGVHSFIEGRLRQYIDRRVGRLAAIAKTRSIPIIFLIPEFNLAAWRSACSGPPVLNVAATSDWLAELEEAESFLRSGDLAMAAERATQICRLDQGSTPAGFNILAEIALRQGKTAEARSHLEKARDSVLSQPMPASPRCYSLTGEILRSYANHKGITVIDLRNRFQEYSNGQLPDHRLFLDYCHLTVEGITLAMASAAEVLLPVISNARKAWSELVQFKTEVDPQIRAEAEFLAAVHNANYGQRTSLVRAQLEHAIQTFPDIKQLMSLFLKTQLRKSPSVLCAEFEQIMETKNASVIQRLYAPPRAPKAFNSVLANELTLAAGGREDLGACAQSILIDEHSVDGARVDLLTRFYCGLASTAAFQPESVRSAGQPLWSGHIDSSSANPNSSSVFFKAREKASHFLLVCNETCNLSLALTYQLSSCSAGTTIAVEVNGKEIASLPATRHWQTSRLAVQDSVLVQGPNVIRIIWPSLQWPSSEWVEGLAKAFECGHFPDIQPIYGEIFSFQAALIGADTHEDSLQQYGKVLSDAL